MSITIMSSNGNHTGTAATSDTLSISASAGSAVIIVLGLVTKTRTVSSITDSASNSGWTQLCGTGSSSAGSCFLWWNPNLASGITSVTTTYSASTKISWANIEVSGLNGAVDGTPTATNHTTAATTGASSVTTTNAYDLIVAGAGAASGLVNSVAAPFTLEQNASGSGVGVGLAADIVSSTGSYTATFTYSASVVSTTAIAALKGTVVSTTPPMLGLLGCGT